MGRTVHGGEMSLANSPWGRTIRGARNGPWGRTVLGERSMGAKSMWGERSMGTNCPWRTLGGGGGGGGERSVGRTVHGPGRTVRVGVANGPLGHGERSGSLVMHPLCVQIPLL